MTVEVKKMSFDFNTCQSEQIEFGVKNHSRIWVLKRFDEGLRFKDYIGGLRDICKTKTML